MSFMRAVLFDVDGTLVDSNYLHIVAWARAFRAAGCAVRSVDIHRGIGMSGSRMMEELIGHARDDVEAWWRREFDAMKRDLRALPGARELLVELARRQVIVGLATSSPEQDLRDLRDAIGADDVISFVTTAGDVEQAKPAPDIFAVALQRAGVEAADAIVVGDTVWDVYAADRCGLACVALLSGGISRAELEDAGAIEVYADPADLLANLDSSALVRGIAGAAAD